MKILLTGGCGYIGSHALLQLLKKGHEVVVFDNLSNSSIESIKRVGEITNTNIIFFNGDIRNLKDLNDVFSKNKFDAVMHFAGLKSISDSIIKPDLYFHNNVEGSKNLISVMKLFKVYKIIFSSSATVYGDPISLPINEMSKIQKPKNPYGESKLIIENFLLNTFKKDPKWSIVILRYFNPVGADSSGLIGENLSGEPNNLMPIIAKVALGKINKLAIYGDDYNTHDGTGIRDYIHVEDLVLGHIASLNKLMLNPGCWTINLGTGKGYSVLDLVNVFKKVSSRDIPVSFVDRRKGDVPSCYADPSYASKILNWKASKDLNDMCIDYWNWAKKNPDGYI
jgi:UDP-glucose 4-epimerase